MLCRALLALASIRHKWKAPGATRACALRSLPALATKWKAPSPARAKDRQMAAIQKLTRLFDL